MKDFKIKYEIIDFCIKNKKLFWFILFTLSSLLILWIFNYVFPLDFYPFLKEALYPFTTALSTIVIAIIAYQNHQIQIPQIEGTLVLCHKNDQMAQELFPNLTSETGFFLIFLVNNTGQKIITIKGLINEKKELLYPIIDKNLPKEDEKKDVHQNSFGYLLEIGKSYRETILLNQHYLKIFKKSKRIYVVDITNRKHLLSTRDLIRYQNRIRAVESKKDKI